jgi:hypothetical protein
MCLLIICTVRIEGMKMFLFRCVGTGKHLPILPGEQGISHPEQSWMRMWTGIVPVEWRTHVNKVTPEPRGLVLRDANPWRHSQGWSNVPSLIGGTICNWHRRDIADDRILSGVCSSMRFLIPCIWHRKLSSLDVVCVTPDIEHSFLDRLDTSEVWIKLQLYIRRKYDVNTPKSPADDKQLEIYWLPGACQKGKVRYVVVTQYEREQLDFSSSQEVSAVRHLRLSRSEFHEGQVPLKARGSCSWCWYSWRHIQRVWNILTASTEKKSATSPADEPGRMEHSQI